MPSRTCSGQAGKALGLCRAATFCAESQLRNVATAEVAPGYRLTRAGLQELP